MGAFEYDGITPMSVRRRLTETKKVAQVKTRGLLVLINGHEVMR